MSDTIETDRLVLRPVLPGDADTITEIVGDRRVYTKVARIPPGQTKDQTAHWIAGHTAGRAADTDHIFALTRADTLIGVIGAHRQALTVPFSIGYWLAPDHWGQGLATEAGQGLIDWLDRRGAGKALVAGYFADNPASGRVLRKLGFLPVGREPLYCAGRDRVVDHVNMARIA
jgi:RimJ/RimL family protein N-acetyltransferase